MNWQHFISLKDNLWKPETDACIELQILEKSFTSKAYFITFFLKIYLTDPDMYCLYQVIFVLKYNFRQLNINSCLLTYKNIYKNRLLRSWIFILTNWSIEMFCFLYGNEIEVFVHLVFSAMYWIYPLSIIFMKRRISL